MGWVQNQCYLCAGRGKLDIGRNLDNRHESLEKCPICKGTGWLDLWKIYWDKPHKRLQ